MNLGAVMTSALFNVGKRVFTERVLVNLIVLLAEWAVSKTSNDLDDRIFHEMKKVLDQHQGRAGNLYPEVKSKNR